MHKSAFQLLRRISLILIFMTDRQTSFPGFFGRLNIHSLTLCVELYACSSPSRAASVLRGDLLSFHSSYTIWVTPRRPSVRRLLGLLQGFLLPFKRLFITSIHHQNAVHADLGALRTKQLRAQVLSRWLVHL